MVTFGLHFFEIEGRQANAKAHEAVDTLASFSNKSRGDFTVGDQPTNLFLEIWVSLHHHPVVWGCLKPGRWVLNGGFSQLAHFYYDMEHAVSTR